MRRSIHLALVAAMALTVVAAEGEDEAAITEHPCYDETTEALAYPTEQVWFHAGSSPLGNADAAGWDTTEPTTSVQGGAGAGAVTPGLAGTAGADTPTATFTGTFTGCMDTLQVDLFSFDPSNRSGTGGSGEPAQHDFSFSLTIDGVEMLTGGPVEALTTHANEGFGPNLNQFALNIGTIMELYAGFDPSIELTGEHTIELRVASWYVNTGHSAYVWDTTEVPSGMTFNGEVGEAVPFVG